MHLIFLILKKILKATTICLKSFTTKGSSDVFGQEGFLVNGLLSQNGRDD